MFYSPTELINLMRQHHFRPRKRWGQNFLVDRNIRDKIIVAVCLKKTDTVIEIGPGFGALTGELSRKAKKVIAIERDQRLAAVLKSFPRTRGNPEVVSADILKFDLNKLSRKVKVVGNLPYYITSPIIVHLLQARAVIDSIIITVQKEVAQRLLSRPDKNTYGAISCFVQFYSNPSLIMKIKRNAFFPRPEVDSSLVKLKILKVPKVRVKDEPLFFRIIRSSFNQRRKILLNSLTAELGLSKQTLSFALNSANINPQRRGETLCLEEFAKIANFLSLR